ncbi:MltF family protein [Govanella unica]|uniref:Transporter substrate-binding domain-containing protein n=1 Tax=Govanella unica TaxID=2975056 RepID=A0A9X3TWU5_9PROT|nr:transporter substrate-binding domain-containing protein [Govania unica]MDA5193103.1 transporter substrate-binding domain-containing protein [Govania unica]
MRRKATLLISTLMLASGPLQAADRVTLSDSSSQPAFGDLETLTSRNLVRVLVPLSRSDFYLDSGSPRGRTAQRLEALATALAPLRVQYILTPRDRLLSDLAAGRGDLAAGGIEISDHGLRSIDFSTAVATPAADVFVTRKGSPAIRSFEDLSGRRVYARRGSRTLAYLHALDAHLAQEGLRPMVILSLPEELGEEDLLDMLNAGLIEATVTSERLAKFWARPLPQIRPEAPLASGDNPEATLQSSGRMAWAFRQESPALAKIVNSTLADFPEPSDEDVARWGANARKLQNARGAAALARLDKALPLFEKYGAELNLEPLVIAAVGFQESRLDHSVRGAGGLTGVMQMRAPIAKQMKAGPVTKFDSNIEAGAKYLAYLANHLFGGAKPDRLNRSLFAAAAYNMGPDRISSARVKAKAMGLDPNIWFDNVELAAMAQSGLRPVLYVRDIFKYYVAYQAEFALRQRP